MRKKKTYHVVIHGPLLAVANQILSIQQILNAMLNKCRSGLEPERKLSGHLHN